METKIDCTIIYRSTTQLVKKNRTLHKEDHLLEVKLKMYWENALWMVQ